MPGSPRTGIFPRPPLSRPLSRLLAAPLLATLLAGLAAPFAGDVRADEPQPLHMPVLVPVTGFLSLEGSSQRDGALLALDKAILPKRVDMSHDVQDTGTEPGRAVNALLKSLDSADGEVIGAVASMFGPQMLAMMPLAEENGIPLITVSGTAKITETGNPWVFRFFPGDAIAKTAQARYGVEVLKASRPAIIYQTTAYGQSGRDNLKAALAKAGIEPVYEEGLAPGVKDMLPTLTKAMDAKPDLLLLQLHSGPTALFVRQYAASRTEGDDHPPVLAGSAMHQPSTAALLEPAELEGVCAESASSPVSGGNKKVEAFTKAYREAYDREPDAFALGQYDGVNMVMQAVRDGARTAEEVRKALSSMTYNGAAMTYKSDGKGNMAHDAIILCYDGKSRTPEIVQRYEGAK